MARRSRDVVGFRRIFVLFTTLVLLPAMLLSGFGVVAISNERSATKQREREEASAQLLAAEARLVGLVDKTEEAVIGASPARLPDAAVSLRRAGLAVGPLAVLEEDGTVRIDPSPPAPGLEPLWDQARTAAERLPVGGLTYLPMITPEQGGVLAMYRPTFEQVVAYVVDEERLRAVARREGQRGGYQVELAVPGPESAAKQGIEQWMNDLMRSEEDGDDLLVTESRLRPPFERYSLRAVGPEPSRTTVVVYIVLLVIFYVMLITGVVITSRLIWQETKLSRLKTDFVSHVSHELRTPLTSIRMFIETLRLGRTSPEEQDECLSLLTRETERLSAMIERVLGYARLRSGRRIFSPSELRVEELIDDALEAFRAQNLSLTQDEQTVSHLEILTDIDEGLPPVHADRLALVEALLNLIGNAYKYTGPDKRIRVFARPSKKKGRVLIGVEDNGPGLPKSEQGRIFDRFYQAGADLLSRPSKGSGLGLAITKGIVEGNRGRIYVQSEEGRGTTFLLELRAADPAPGAERRASAEGEKSPPRADGPPAAQEG